MLAVMRPAGRNKRIDDEIIAQFSSRGNITTENRNSTMVFDHFESSNLDGDILVGDQDALENAASGSGNRASLIFMNIKCIRQPMT